MTPEQRAQQVWSVLIFAAREQKLISYPMLSQITGLGQAPESVLRYVRCYCRQQHLAPLNAIVIDPESGRPEDCDLRHLREQQSRVFLYDWLSYPVPSEEMFRQAAETEQEELERANAEYVALPC